MSLRVELAIAFNLVMVAVLTLGVARGGRPERVGALINIAGFIATTAFRLAAPGTGWTPGAMLVLVIDACVAGGFFWLGVTTIRFWPIWATGFALADLFMSICGALLPDMSLLTYHTGLGVYAYLALGALAIGTFRLPANAEPDLRNGIR